MPFSRCQPTSYRAYNGLETPALEKGDCTSNGNEKERIKKKKKRTRNQLFSQFWSAEFRHQIPCYHQSGVTGKLFCGRFLFLAFLLLFSKMKIDVLKSDFKFLSAV